MRVLVLGGAVSGRAAARLAIRLGNDVTIYDRDPAATADSPPDAEIVTGDWDRRLLDAVDLVVTSPGIPEHAPPIRDALESAAPLVSELEFAAAEMTAPYVAITGTNGKTTVTEATAAMLRAGGLRACAAGNVGLALSDVALDEWDCVAVEASSFQLRFIDRFHPCAAAILNVAPDHLDWHGSFIAYAAAKARIWRNQTPEDVLVFDAHDAGAVQAAAGARARKVAASGVRRPAGGNGPEGDRLVIGEITFPLPALDEIWMLDLTVAATLASAAGAPAHGIERIISEFSPGVHRRTVVAEHDGVTWVNDSKATNPHAAVAAAAAYPSVVLIAGGRNKGLDLTPVVAAPSVRRVIAIGEAAAELAAAGGSRVRIAPDLPSAVALAAVRCASGRHRAPRSRVRELRHVRLLPGARRGLHRARLGTDRGRRMTSRAGASAPHARAQDQPRPQARVRRAPERRAVLLLLPVAILLVIGLGAVLSASSVVAIREGLDQYAIFRKQLAFVGIGVVAMTITARIPYRWYARIAPILLILAVAGLIATMFVGSVRGGSRRWIELGPITLQASEFAKFAVVVFLSAALTRKERHLGTFSHVFWPLAVSLGSVSVLLLRQPDLGTALLIAGAAFAVLLASAAPLRHIAALGGAGALAAVGLAIAEPYRLERVLSFLDPNPDRLDEGLQAFQSLVALGTGGIFGVGLGASRARWSFLPNAHTDFIFAIIGEETGLAGSLTVLALFVVFAVVGTVVALRASDPFGRLVATGIVTWLSLQAIVNIGGVVKALPITGVPLPFVSAGGSAMIVNLAVVGVLVNIARNGLPAERRAR